MKKQQIIDILIKYQDTLNYAGSCGELGDATQAVDADYFDDIADDILKDFEPKKCMPDNIHSKEEHEEYLKAIGYEKHVKDLQHHKDTTIGLYAFDKEIETIFENIPDKEGCKTSVEAYLVQQIDYLKSIVFQIK